MWRIINKYLQQEDANQFTYNISELYFSLRIRNIYKSSNISLSTFECQKCDWTGDTASHYAACNFKNSGTT